VIRIARLGQAARKRPDKAQRPTEGQGPGVARWRINGHPAVVVIWTADEWGRLTERPEDAQYCGCGVWCALRLA
jgi:hypothetical protein